MSVKSILKKIMIVGISLIAVLIIALVAWFFILGQKSQPGNPPGLVDNRLTQCPATPNCVCSEYPDDSLHAISSIKFSSNTSTNIKDQIKTVITTMGGTVQREQENYLAATFTSAIFKFVDDFEVRVDNQHQVIHVRSASRVGEGDLGVNRKRVERFRTELLNAITANQ